MMKNRNKPIQAALFFCVIPLLLTTNSCTTQDKKIANIHPWTKDVDSLAKGKADSRFWSKVRSQSTLVDAFKRLGGFYQKQGKHKKAIAEFIKAIKMKTDDAGVYNSLAMSYDALKEYKYAEMAYKDAIALDPEQPYLYNNYGCSCLLRGDIDAAVALFEKAASLDTESHRIKNNLSLAIYWGNKDKVSNKDNQGASQLPGQYVTEEMLADNTELKAEIGNSKKNAPVFSDETAETVEVEAITRPIIENIEEPVKEAVLIEPAEIQPEVGDTAVKEIFDENIAETRVSDEVQVDEELTETQPVKVEPVVEESVAKEVVEKNIAETKVAEEVLVEDMIADETQPILVEDMVAETVEDVEEVKFNNELTVRATETSIDEKVTAESRPPQVVKAGWKETASIAARTTDDESRWYNKFITSALAVFGFENNENKRDVAPSVENDQPVVAQTNNELINSQNESFDNKVEAQEIVVEESIADIAVTEDEQQVGQAVIQKQPEEQLISQKTEDDISIEAVALAETVIPSHDFEVSEAELPTVENVADKPPEREVVVPVAVSTLEVPEGTIGPEVVSTEVVAVDEQVSAPVQAIISTDPDIAQEDLAVTVQADETPEVVNEISNTKAERIIQVKAMIIADTVDDFSSKPDVSIAEAQIPTLNRADSVKKKIAEVTDDEQEVQGKPRVAIEVSNGNGVEGMARRSAAYLREQGRYVGRITNAKHFGFNNSTVFYRKGYLREAYNVALMVPGYQEMKQVESLGRPEINVKLLLGKDMASLGFPESMSGISYQQISNYGQTVTMLSR